MAMHDINSKCAKAISCFSVSLRLKMATKSLLTIKTIIFNNDINEKFSINKTIINHQQPCQWLIILATDSKSLLIFLWLFNLLILLDWDLWLSGV